MNAFRRALGAAIALVLTASAALAAGGVPLGPSGYFGGGSSGAPGYGYTTSGFYVPSGYQSLAGTGQIGVATDLYCTPGKIDAITNGGSSTGTLALLFARVTTVGTGSFQIGMYANDYTANPYRPGTFLGSTASLSDTALATLSAAPSPTITGIGPGLYWFCIEAETSAAGNDTAVRFSAPVSSTQSNFFQVLVGDTSASNALGTTTPTNSVAAASGAFGTWPSTGHGLTWVVQGLAAVTVGFSWASFP
jgi:hypothetical protein